MRYAIGLLVVVMCLLPASFGQSPPENTVTCTEGETIGLRYGDHTNGCEISYDIDLDIFTFDGVAGDSFSLSLSASGFDPLLEIRDPMNDPLPNGSCTGNPTCRIFHGTTLDLTGTYTIRVSDQGFDDYPGSYFMDLDLGNPRPWSTGLPYDSPRRESIDFEFDRDFFSFKGRAGTEVRIVVINKSQVWSPRLRIRNPSGSVSSTWSCTGSGCSFFVDYTVIESGTHTAELADDNRLQTGEYQVSVQCLFGLCPEGYYIDSVILSSPDELTWAATSDPSAMFDVVRGDLNVLSGTGGDFSAAVTDCISTGNVLPFANDFDPPNPGEGFFYLVRALEVEIGIGSYDTASPSQLSRFGGRDIGPKGVDNSPNACAQSLISGSFVPDEPDPGPNTVSMREDMAVGDSVTIDLAITDTGNIHTAGFDVVFDDTAIDYLGYNEGSLFEQGGNSPIYLVSAQPGRIVVGISRSGSSETAAVGTQSMILLTFRVTQAGTSPVSLSNYDLLDGNVTVIPGISWYGGSLIGD